nr:DUF4176 domain-containing protein [Bacillus sp. CGMCC 1.16541]
MGTVVKLKSFKKPVMIYGHHQIQGSTNKQYDYVSAPYPEGNISSDYNLFFSRDQIKEVLHLGYETEEGKVHLEKIEESPGSINEEDIFSE